MELRTDPLTGVTVAIAGDRQSRPNLPSDDCPFCPGGLEAPEPYRTRWFPNRWPSFPEERCEVVLYTPDHEARFWSLGVAHAAEVVDLWAERTTALGSRPDVGYVLVFENRGPEVGATISHPHGQIYAYERVPDVPLRELERSPSAAGCSLCAEDPGDRLVAEHGGWRAWVPWASVHPYGVVIAPTTHEPNLPSLDAAGRRDLAACLIDVLGRLDHLWPQEPGVLPSMLWIHQRPTDGGDWPGAHLHVEVAVPMRAPGVRRFIAGGELGGGLYVNPVVPEEAAATLRAVTWGEAPTGDA